ncbi:fibronectin type III domain-containing protein, partial [Herbidospora yilanensis]|uniref:fibronectin type III domain-containing protein n=1 Tax=Herbidospora yilanensis TaxID=354426 RepID=UPI000A75165A
TATRPTPPVVSGGGDTQAPSVPANLVVTNRTATSVTLSWAASTDHVGVASYQVNRGGTAAGTTAATTFTVTGLTPDTAYFFTVVARDAAGNASAPSAGVSATTLPQTTAYVALRARVNNRFVTANAGQHLIANATTVGAAQQFERVNLAGGQIALRARSNDQYVCAENAGAAPLIANRAAVGPWETFTLVQNPNGSVSLRSQANDQYVCAENSGAAALIANRAAIGGWEQFDIVTQ